MPLDDQEVHILCFKNVMFCGEILHSGQFYVFVKELWHEYPPSNVCVHCWGEVRLGLECGLLTA